MKKGRKQRQPKRQPKKRKPAAKSSSAKKFGQRSKKKKDGKKVVRITLRQKLQQIYYGTVNLDTTCKGRCECCNVAMPQLNHSAFTHLINEVWEGTTSEEKIELICQAIEYFFYYDFEKFGMKTMIKPCMLLDKDGKCQYYDARPLDCRMYGLWPKKVYKARVDKFVKAYKGLLSRREIPLSKQCPYVKRVDDAEPLNEEVIESLYEQLNELDKKLDGSLTDTQIEQGENRRTFHDWLLLKVFGEGWLTKLTSFLLAADPEIIEDQKEQIIKAVRDAFGQNMPKLFNRSDLEVIKGGLEEEVEEEPED